MDVDIEFDITVDDALVMFVYYFVEGFDIVVHNVGVMKDCMFAKMFEDCW